MLDRSLRCPRRPLSAEGIQGPEDLRRHAEAAPPLGRGEERGAEERETRPLPGKAGDELRVPGGLAEGSLQEVRGPDALPELHGEEEIRHALLEVCLETLHGRRKRSPEPGE